MSRSFLVLRRRSGAERLATPQHTFSKLLVGNVQPTPIMIRQMLIDMWVFALRVIHLTNNRGNIADHNSWLGLWISGRSRLSGSPTRRIGYSVSPLANYVDESMNVYLRLLMSLFTSPDVTPVHQPIAIKNRHLLPTIPAL